MFGGGIFGVGGGTLGTLGADDAEAGDAMRPQPTIHDILASSGHSSAQSSFTRQKAPPPAIPDSYAIVNLPKPLPPPAPVAVSRPAPLPPRIAPPARPSASALPPAKLPPPRPVAPLVRALLPSQMPATPGGVVQSQMPATPGGVVRPAPPPVVPAPTVAVKAPLKGLGIAPLSQMNPTTLALWAAGAGAVGYALAPKKHKKLGAALGAAVPLVLSVFGARA